MAPSIRNWLTFLRLKLKMVARRPLFFLVFLLARIFKPKLVLTYDNEVLCDGTGAQIQRILAIHSLAKSLGCKYLHSPIRDVSVHPLDSHQTEVEYKDYLDRLNSFIELPSDIDCGQIQDCIVKKIPNLHFRELFLMLMRSKRLQLIKLVDVYSVVDCVPKIYHHARNLLIPRIFLPKEITPQRTPILAVHYRSVPGDFSIYNGEGQSRQLQISRIENVLSKAVKKIGTKDFKLVVFTDSPTNDIVINVFPPQQIQWIGTPGYSEGKLHLRGRNLLVAFSRFSSNIEIVIGGDPLDAITRMATADILITSKSSLSYVSAMLSRNSFVFSPIEFWHPIPWARRF